MQPIGRFLSVYKLRYGTPRQGGVSELARGRLVLRQDIPACSLEGIHEYSHLWLIFKFNFNENKSVGAKVHPPRLLGTSVGLFATRTPHRYNPIGLSRVKLDRVDYETKTLYLSGIDLLEGTEILDVKPYHPADSLDSPAIPTWMQQAPHHPLEVTWSPAALQQLENALPKLEFYDNLVDVQEAIGQSLAGDPRPDYIRKRCAHEHIYGFRFDALNVLFHTEGTEAEANKAVIVEVQVVADGVPLVDDYKSDSDSSVREASPVRFVMNQQPKPGSREGSPTRLASLNEIATAAAAQPNGPVKLTEKEKLKLHLEKSEGHNRYRNAKEANLKAERLQQGAVTPEQMAEAQRVVEAIAASEFEYPKGSEEHEAHKNFRNACLRWLKPGKTVNRREVILDRKLVDQEALEATGIRNLRNQKKRYLAFSHGAVLLEDQGKIGENVNNNNGNGNGSKSGGVTITTVSGDALEQTEAQEGEAEETKAAPHAEESKGENVETKRTTASIAAAAATNNNNNDDNSNTDNISNNTTTNNNVQEPRVNTEEDIADFLSNLNESGGEVKEQSSTTSTTTSSSAPNASPSASTRSINSPKSRGFSTAAARSAEDDISSSSSSSNSSEEGGENKSGVKYLSKSISCYVCKMHFVILHHFYDRMCPTCAEFNMQKRVQTCDLKGKIALVTGGRIKIGFEAVLILLRAGCEVITTTRFPRDAALRFSREADYAVWRSRLKVYALDLRVLPALECFVYHLNTTLPRLDILINNAAQTIRRPPAFYRHLMPLERAPLQQLTDKVGVLGMIHEFASASQLPTLTGAPAPAPSLAASSTSSPSSTPLSTSTPAPATDLPPLSSDTPAATSAAPTAAVTSTSESLSTSFQGPGSGVLSTLSVMGSGLSAAELSQVAILAEDLNSDPKHFPADEYDFNGQQLDLRHSNTWVLPLDQVSSAEAAEVHVINALAPFILNSKLKALMCKSGDPGFIINVSSMEGRFASYKEPVHPHTNMAKAALNMMTCTSAKDYAFAKIYMNSVDTGWVTEENPDPLARRKNGFGPPLDEIDGAARILDPIFSALLTGRYEFGRFYKDYKHSRWEFAHHDQ